jgi:transcription elongation GreA/GreB family factor
MRQKILNLFEEVKKIEKSSSIAANESNRAANEASGGLAASYSAAGDVEHARNSANLSIQKVATIKKLAEELEKSLESEIPGTVKPVCFISIKFENGSQKDLYFVENPVFLSGFNLISPESPLGKSLMGMSIGNSFSYSSSYSSDVQAFRGTILTIE